MELWIVGNVTDRETLAWEFCGVYDTLEMAISKCTNSKCTNSKCTSARKWYFIGPAVLNETVLGGTTVWPGGFYPNEIEETKRDAQ